MSNTWALLPVKPPLQSKSRLSSILQPQECAALSKAMLRDVINALELSSCIDRIAVLTCDTEVAELVSELGHSVIKDTVENPGSASALCEGLQQATTFIAQQGGDTVCIIPADLPTISAQDIDALLHRHGNNAEPRVSLCPAIRDGGTNALVCTPPDALTFEFGPDSANRHLQQADKQGLKAERAPMHAFFRDIDMPEDLLWLAQQDNCPNTLNYLRDSGLFARLDPALTLRASA
ncbi:MAG: 2-phospho-L-lactate guanylyltransferase [Gammaproteobacteria bacterium]